MQFSGKSYKDDLFYRSSQTASLLVVEERRDGWNRMPNVQQSIKRLQ
jgi:hypothetical protein